MRFHCRNGLIGIVPLRKLEETLSSSTFSTPENVAIAWYQVINCHSGISDKQQNRLRWRAVKLSWSIWPLKPSELCRPEPDLKACGSCVRPCKDCTLQLPWKTRQSHGSMSFVSCWMILPLFPWVFFTASVLFPVPVVQQLTAQRSL